MTATVQRRLMWLLAVGQGAVLVGLALYPINSIMIRVPMLALGCTLWATALALAWPQNRWRWSVVALPVSLGVVLMLPGRVVDSADLRERLVTALRRYEGVTYIWGGENAVGIDCSGLVRRARMDAEWSYAVAHLDAGAIRRALSLWWFDQSALAMGQLDRGLTVQVSEVPSLAGCPPERYLPGDFAIISGAHVVAALGGGTWIEADPGEGKVLILPPGSDNTWLKQKATLVRWTVLQEP
jgi:NlpC/P60 family